MCGIAGFIDPRTHELEPVSRAMARALLHRGPDDAGTYVQRDVGLGLAFRRLAIVDLSPAGHQPMTSASGRYEIIFNGEIYNHLQIRGDLNGQGAGPWRGRSDTETLLAAIETWGIQASLRRCVGMFALAVWDRQLRRLTLARDRIGEKPLYYGRCGGAFLFGSELKALQAHPAFRAEIDRGCLALYLRHCYVPEPFSIFQGIRRVPPGTTVEIDAAGQPGEPVSYWSAASITDLPRERRFAGDDRQAIEALDALLSDAVRLQMVADVPLGAFLSGGIDSSLIVALMQKQSARRVRTFTIGFTEPAYDESSYARAVATHLGTEHTELIVTPTEAMKVIPRLCTVYDEPFADSSQIPTFLVSQLARQHVTVALSGDAGDELFGGYNRYAWAKRVWMAMRLQWPVRKLTARAIRALPPEAWSRMFGHARTLVPQRWHAVQMGDKLHKFADLIDCSRADLYRTLVSHWPQPAQLVVAGHEPATLLGKLMAEPGGRTFEECMMYWDLMTYLPGDILVKVDRAAMAVSLETRVPMLDHRVIEFAWSLPLRLRVRSGEGKWLLKRLLGRYVPPQLTERPKTGFGIPIDSWLRGPLRPWAEELLAEARLRDEGFFKPQAIREKWRQHLEGGRNWAYWLWDVLMFQAWWQAQSQRNSVPDAVSRRAL
ncbi:MAG TPA: asparagine synthase (glutamine-hydrolyzing) [Steroidobacteraceae bacterium]|jgi:asparagine synthase (glutamine-hydrolysing)